MFPTQRIGLFILLAGSALGAFHSTTSDVDISSDGTSLVCDGLTCTDNAAKCSVSKEPINNNQQIERVRRCLSAKDEVITEATSVQMNVNPEMKVNFFAEATREGVSISNGPPPKDAAESSSEAPVPAVAVSTTMTESTVPVAIIPDTVRSESTNPAVAVAEMQQMPAIVVLEPVIPVMAVSDETVEDMLKAEVNVPVIIVPESPVAVVRKASAEEVNESTTQTPLISSTIAPDSVVPLEASTQSVVITQVEEKLGEKIKPMEAMKETIETEVQKVEKKD